MISEMSWDGLWTLSFGLSQLDGHGSWLLCEMFLNHGKGELARVGCHDANMWVLKEILNLYFNG